jgi:hypothetical protein
MEVITPEPEKIYSSYTDAQKRATNKYREANKEKVNAQRKKYYEERKEKDPEFLQYKRDKAKEYYLKKKGQKEATKEEIKEEIKDGVELVSISLPDEDKEDEGDTIEEHWLKKSLAKNSPVVSEDDEKPPFEELVQVKPKVTRKPRAKKETPKPNLQLNDLKELLLPETVPPPLETPKAIKSRKSKAKDILLSA